MDISILDNDELMGLSGELAPMVVKEAAGAMGMLASGVGRLMTGAVKTPGVARTAIGAGVGAAGGVARHMMSGRNPQTGQKNTTLLGSMAGGAALGGVAGAGARQAAMRVGSMNNGVGSFARNAMFSRGGAMVGQGGAAAVKAGQGAQRSALAMDRIATRGAAGRTATGGMKPVAAGGAPGAGPMKPGLMDRAKLMAARVQGYA